MATYQELMAQKAALDEQTAQLEKQIAETLRAERTGVINQIKTLMADHGVTLADLGAKAGKPVKAPAGDVTRKVAPKYRDPNTGETWSGRGLKPKWLSAALETGRTLDEFAV
ncbi:DNA-binding protein H-NS [Sphaerotilus hippei]|uniref:DNA-binding protein H-NS n=1 Tax=Sphaerotilus hippei TaxID=744406 RepID=A0A318H3N6_9BURK|nr:H-NS histone family protein [Sphaerotilus hippei]PXW98167.1 DNA-binding protein H-NS [Sphaerotilus hippei]